VKLYDCSCSLAVFDPRVGHTMDVRSPFIPVKGSPYSITERRVPELIPVLCSQPAGNNNNDDDDDDRLTAFDPGQPG